MSNKWKNTGIVIAGLIGSTLGVLNTFYAVTFSLGMLYGGYMIPLFVDLDSSS